MDDLISRQAAIDEFDGVKVDEENCTEYDIGFNDGIDFSISKLSVLPSAQPEQRWIPVKNRLPEEGSVVMLTVWNEQKGRYELSYPAWYMHSMYADCCYFYISNESGRRSMIEDKYVIAWRRLPEPYQPEEDA